MKCQRLQKRTWKKYKNPVKVVRFMQPDRGKIKLFIAKPEMQGLLVVLVLQNIFVFLIVR